MKKVKKLLFRQPNAPINSAPLWFFLMVTVFCFTNDIVMGQLLHLQISLSLASGFFLYLLNSKPT